MKSTIICSRLEWIPFMYVTDITENVATLTSGQSFGNLDLQNGTLTQQVSEDTGGVIVNQVLNAIINPDKDTRKQLATTPGILRLLVNNSDSPIIWGTIKNPVKMQSLDYAGDFTKIQLGRLSLTIDF